MRPNRLPRRVAVSGWALAASVRRRRELPGRVPPRSSGSLPEPGPHAAEFQWRSWIGKTPWVLAAVLIADLMVAGLTLRQRPEFQAATVINTGVSSGVSLSGAPTDWFRAGALIANIEEVLRSRTVLEGTIRMLGLKTTPDRLTRRIAIARMNQTDLIKISATASTGREASDLANAHVASFLSTWERMEGEGARMALEFARDQMGKAAERLRDAESRLKQFRKAAMPDSRVANAQRAADLATQEAQVERQLLAARAGLKAAETEIARHGRDARGGIASRGLQGPELMEALERLRRLEANLQDARERGDPAAPLLETQVRTARQALARAEAQVGADPGLADATARRVALLVEIAQAEAQLASIRRDRENALAIAQRAEADAVTYAELQREVALREADYRALVERVGQARLLAAGASHSTIRIVDPATPPDRPASRKLPLKLAIASMVAAIFALAVLHLRDLVRQTGQQPAPRNRAPRVLP